MPILSFFCLHPYEAHAARTKLSMLIATSFKVDRAVAGRSTIVNPRKGMRLWARATELQVLEERKMPTSPVLGAVPVNR
jgi:hypothetical protein